MNFGWKASMDEYEVWRKEIINHHKNPSNDNGWVVITDEWLASSKTNNQFIDCLYHMCPQNFIYSKDEAHYPMVEIFNNDRCPSCNEKTTDGYKMAALLSKI